MSNYIEFTCKGNELYDESKYNEAIEWYDESLTITADNKRALNNKGNSLRSIGKYDEALNCYDKALEMRHDFHEALNGKGNVLNDLGRYDEAIECFDNALKIKPNYVYSLNSKGSSLHYLKRYQEAIEWYDKALHIKPDYLLALNNKGIALKDIGRYDEAIECFDNALKIKPDLDAALNGKGSTLHHLKRYQEAIECYDKALRIKPDDEVAVYNKNLAKKAIKRNLKLSVIKPSEIATGILPSLTKVLKFKESTLKEKSKNNDNKHDVFISYSRKQKKQAKKLYNILKNSGLTCWMDDNELELGDQLFQRLAEAIISSNLILFCISKDYIKSDNCLREFNFSIEHRKTYIPLLFCKDKRAEFDKWPSTHYVFFTMGKAIYDSEIFKHLDNDNLNINNPIFNSFLQQIKNKALNN